MSVEQILAIWKRYNEITPSKNSEQLLLSPGSLEALLSMMNYSWEEGHLEVPERLSYPILALNEHLWVKRKLRWNLLLDHQSHHHRLASNDELRLAHDEYFVSSFVEAEAGKGVDFDALPNVSCCEENESAAAILKAARTSAATTLDTINHVLRHGGNAFALVRPPGHHCTASRSGGNGVVNNVAIAALHAAQKDPSNRVLIVDVDIHFSGGRPLSEPPADQLLDNIYLVDVYGARGQEIRARARAEGRKWSVKECSENSIFINAALLDERAGDDVYNGDSILGEIRRTINGFCPTILIVSCGFDAAQGDNEGFTLTPHGYYTFIAGLCEAMGDLPVVLVLEGGYKPDIVARCVCSCALALMHQPDVDWASDEDETFRSL